VRRGFEVDWPRFNPPQACDGIIPSQSPSIQPGLGIIEHALNKFGAGGAATFLNVLATIYSLGTSYSTHDSADQLTH
jgi:hypothetical protein